MQDTVRKKKYIHLEIMRVVTIFFVIFNHTGYDGYLVYHLSPVNSVTFWLYLAISVFCKFSVPLYFAISGALLLGREPEPLKKLMKRVLRMLAVLVLISLFYYCVTLYKQGNVFDMKYFLGAINTVYLKYHLGFLYAYIVFLLTLPFLQALVKSLDEKFFYYMMVVALFFDGIRPIVEYLKYHGNRSLTETLQPAWLLSKVVLYPCIGYFLQHRFTITKRKIAVLSITNILGIAVCCFMTYYKGLVEGDFASETFHNNFVLLNCMWIFCLVKFLTERKQIHDRIEKVIVSMGSSTFGIYLIHIFFLEHPLRTQLVSKLIENQVNYMLTAFFLCGIVFVICYTIITLLKKVPPFKQLL